MSKRNKKVCLSKVDLIEDALSSPKPVRELSLVLDEDSSAEKKFHWLYAALLEVQSSGVFVLPERLPLDEVRYLAADFRCLGAVRMADCLQAIIGNIEKEVGVEPDMSTVVSYTTSDKYAAFILSLNLRAEEIILEMESAVLRYVHENIEEIKGVDD